MSSDARARKGKGGRGRVTLDDVAAHAGVSRSTASLVVRNSDLISPETGTRVRRAMAALGYVYNQSAAHLRTQRSRTLGMIIADMANPFYALLASGIESECGRHRYVTIFADAKEDGERQTTIVNRLIEHDVAGVFMCASGDTTTGNVRRLEDVGIPTVLLMRHVDGLDANYVGPDNVAGMRGLVGHLAEQDHQRIAFIGGPKDRSSSLERLQGFEEGMRACGLKLVRSLVRSTRDISRHAAMEAAADLLDANRRPTAIVCYNDLMAFGTMLAMFKRGLEPGHDVAVTGFDDIPESVLWTPSLTTMSIDAENIGRIAAGAMLARIDEPNRAHEQLIVRPRLMVRDSSARPALRLAAR